MTIRSIVTSKRFVAAATIPATVLASGALVMASSYSAFSAKTDNPVSNWAAGTVNLTDDDNGAALFTTGTNAGNLKPGASGTKCIVVTSSGSLASTVKLYAKTGSYTQSKGLGDNINLKVEEGTGGSFNDCTGFTAQGAAIVDSSLTAFSNTKQDFSTGAGAWAPNGGNATKTYRVTYKLADNTPDTAQGGTASIALVWEAQNS
ncbi:hypothetical protein [Nocardioides marmoraquaticus]